MNEPKGNAYGLMAVLQYVTAGFPQQRDKRVTIRGDERR
jgi:hypothetical protein